jgi:hypothetical protein
MYISRLVKTRDPHPSLLIIAIQFPFLLILTVYLLSLIRLLSSLVSSYSFPYLHLLFVYLGGSAIMPSHIQRGPSVTIPSV